MVAVEQLAKEHTVQLQTVQARYFEAGTGYPTICLHGVGFTAGGFVWLPCIKAGLAANSRILALDMLGWGAGERPTWNYSFSYLVDHIREFQDVMGLEKTNIVGHSLGGWVGATLAYESPERVNKLVVVANAGLNPDPPAGLRNFAAPSKEAVGESMQIVQDPELRQALTDEAWKNVETANALESYAKINENLFDYDMRRRYYLRRRLPFIKVPTLIVYGEKDTGYPPETMGKEMAEGIPGNRFEVVPDAGHFIPLEKPRELTTLITGFLG
jgi:pimeloyl-ACP methyl ester carboxylesterase